MAKGYEPRDYRYLVPDGDWRQQTVICNETDIQVYATRDLVEGVNQAIHQARGIIGAHIKQEPEFATSLEPVANNVKAHDLVAWMKEASHKAGVGPMASVASAINQYVADLIHDPELMLENGGDLYIRSRAHRKVLIHAGSSPLSEQLALLVPPAPEGIGVCTSSGTVGHSLSFGQADAAIVISKDPLLADACATALGNRVKEEGDIDQALEWVSGLRDIEGALVILGEKIGLIGDVHLVAAS